MVTNLHKVRGRVLQSPRTNLLKKENLKVGLVNFQSKESCKSGRERKAASSCIGGTTVIHQQLDAGCQEL